MSAVQQTSLFAFEEIQPKIGKKQKAVRDMLALHADMTDKELAYALGWEINTVTPRRGELVKAGFVVWAQTRPCKRTSKRAHAWKVINHK